MHPIWWHSIRMFWKGKNLDHHVIQCIFVGWIAVMYRKSKKILSRVQNGQARLQHFVPCIGFLYWAVWEAVKPTVIFFGQGTLCTLLSGFNLCEDIKKSSTITLSHPITKMAVMDPILSMKSAAVNKRKMPKWKYHSSPRITILQCCKRGLFGRVIDFGERCTL